MNNLDEVALLITHYNRSQSLTRLLQSFKDQQFIFGEIIVSDDASLPSHQLKLKQLQNEFGFKLITTPQNKGLGHNINKGQDAVTKPYTLYIQEDFIPIPGCANHLLNALQLMQNNERLDIIRFYAYFTYPDLKPYQKGFSEMVFKWRTINHLKFYYYSDHPHLRRSSFLQKFGRYPEGNSSDLTEYKMAILFIKKNGKGLFYNQFDTLFNQCNSLAEPSTVPRSNWQQSKKILVLAIRAVYLKYKLLKGHADLLLANS